MEGIISKCIISGNDFPAHQHFLNPFQFIASLWLPFNKCSKLNYFKWENFYYLKLHEDWSLGAEMQFSRLHWFYNQEIFHLQKRFLATLLKARLRCWVVSCDFLWLNISEQCPTLSDVVSHPLKIQGQVLMLFVLDPEAVEPGFEVLEWHRWNCQRSYKV